MNAESIWGTVYDYVCIVSDYVFMLSRSQAVVIFVNLDGSFMLKKRKRYDVIKFSNGGRNDEDKGMKRREVKGEDTVTHLLKVRIVEREKQPLLRSVRRNSGITIRSGVFSVFDTHAI